MAKILIPESLTAGIDALGNALTPRTSKTFNADGSGYAIVPNDNSLDLTTEATWVFKADPSGMPTTRSIISKWDGAAALRAFNISFLTASRIQWTVFDSGGVSGTLTVLGLPSGVATFVLTYNAGTLRCYRNGVEVGSTVTAVTSLNVTTKDIYIMKLETQSANIQPNPISDIKIYNRALTADEVTDFFFDLNSNTNSFPLTLPTILP